MDRSQIDLPRAREILEAMTGARVAVIGDLFLDEYLVGRAERLSREGPVPVLAYRRRFCRPGGAANPARNVAALGAVARIVGVIGPDAAGEELLASLRDAGLDPDGVIVDPHRPTTRKTRVVAEGLAVPQQVARIDRQERAAVHGEALAQLTDAVGRAATGSSAVLVSHYRSGVVTPRVVDAARRAATAGNALLTVDAQGDLDRFRGFDLVRVGRADAAASLGRAVDSERDAREATSRLRDRLEASVVILGRGASGTSVADVDGYVTLPPANVSEVYDVTGAGDTVIAVVTLAMAGGVDARTAVALANRAAGVVVRRLGVAAPRAEEILASFSAQAGDEPRA